MNRNRQNIVVVGLGYIGLPTASILAVKGHTVLGVDVVHEVVDTINSGKIHIIEPDLDALVKSAVNSGRFSADSVPIKADTFILAVPTPFQQGLEKKPDLTFVEAAVDAVIPFLRHGSLIILESTSPVGTTEMVYQRIVRQRPEILGKFLLAYCPERVMPGQIIRELIDNDRIIGGINRVSAEKARELYKTFCNGTIILTDCRTAEMVKLAENSYRDVNIAFANELSMICGSLDINVWEVIKFANRHPRVNILRPGPGVGGHCIAVDPWFIVSSAPEKARLIRTAREVNDSKEHWVIEQVLDEVEKLDAPVIIGCLGLSFKANVDDVRESPALHIALELSKRMPGRVVACEPHLQYAPEGLELVNLEELLQRADIVLLLVDHDLFMEIDPRLLKKKVLVDTRGILN